MLSCVYQLQILHIGILLYWNLHFHKIFRPILIKIRIPFLLEKNTAEGRIEQHSKERSSAEYFEEES